MRTSRGSLPVLALALLVLGGWTACSDDPAGPGGAADAVDRVPPEQIETLVLSYTDAGGNAVLTWTAPRDDARDTVSRYEIRYGYSSPILWDISPSAPDPPVPARSGEPERYEFIDPLEGRDLYAAIRSFDDAGNASAISSPAHVHIDGFELRGQCRDALTGAALADLEVAVTDRRVHGIRTDVEGRFALEDLCSGRVNVSLRSGGNGNWFHEFDLAFDLSSDVSQAIVMIEYMPAELAGTDNIFQLLLQAAGISAQKPRLKKWRSYPIPVYVPPFVNVHGIDYEDICKRCVAQWNSRTGEEIFQLTAAPPAVGVTLSFKTRVEMDNQNGITHHTNDDEGFPVRSDVDIIDEFPSETKLLTIALHELGHTIRLAHLPDGYLMYAGQPLPFDVTDDEAKLVRLYISLPNDFDPSPYDPSDPR
jgi:hypothetical protein